MRILVCGGRDYVDARIVYDVLDDMCKWKPVSVIIHGAASGADTLAKKWAKKKGIQDEPYPVTRADWVAKGHAAGPIRNQQMLDKGKPDIVLAFPGGRGTLDMIRRAKKAGLPVYTPAPPSKQEA